MTSIHEIHLTFLRAERYKADRFMRPEDAALVDDPDLDDPEQNRQRMRLLYYHRRSLMGEIPPDTVWSPMLLREGDLDDVMVIARCGWDAQDDHNQVRRVAARAPLTLRAPPSEWTPIILWAHQATGPWTILEGNHRLIAYASTPAPPPLELRCFVGVSASHCLWHRTDPSLPLVYDFWKPPPK